MLIYSDSRYKISVKARWCIYPDNMQGMIFIKSYNEYLKEVPIKIKIMKAGYLNCKQLLLFSIIHELTVSFPLNCNYIFTVGIRKRRIRNIIAGSQYLQHLYVFPHCTYKSFIYMIRQAIFLCFWLYNFWNGFIVNMADIGKKVVFNLIVQSANQPWKDFTPGRIITRCI